MIPGQHRLSPNGTNLGVPTVSDVLEVLESIAPKRYAFDFDKVGLQVGDGRAEVTKAVVSLDRSLASVRYAAAIGAELLLAHHPLLFHPISSVVASDPVGQTVLELLANGISFIAAHTNWDSAKGGVNDALAAKLGLVGVRDFGSAAAVRRLKMVVFIPEGALQQVIDAASGAGAGIVGTYSRCAAWSSVTGTFHSGMDSNPTIGAPGETSETPEMRLEMVLSESAQRAVDAAVRQVHPYEEPEIGFFRLVDDLEQPAGRIGTMPIDLTFEQFAAHVDQSLGTRCLAWGNPHAPVEKVAVVGGAADGEWLPAKASGADVFVTGEVRQHIALEAAEFGIPIVAAGHYATEQPGCAALRARMATLTPDIEWSIFEPSPGTAGRPL